VRRFINQPGVLFPLALLTFAACDERPQETGPPDPIRDLVAGAANDSTISLVWTSPRISAGDRLIVYHVHYELADSTAADSFEYVPTSVTPQIIDGVSVSGLRRDTEYAFTVAGESEEGGIAEASNRAAARTARDSIPPDPILDLRVLERRDHSITLGWTAVGDDGIKGRATRYDVRYARNGTAPFNFNAATQVHGVNPPFQSRAADSVTIDGLQQNTPYTFAVHVFDEVDNRSPQPGLVQAGTLRVNLEWHVRKDGLGDTKTIQAAIDSASLYEGHTVLVFPGIYHEAIRFRGANVQLKSAGGPDVTTIDATGLESSVIQIRNGEQRQTLVEGFTITGGVGSPPQPGGGRLGGGILILSSNPTIRGNVVRRNGRVNAGPTISTNWGGGIYCGQTPGNSGPIIGASPLIEGNTIEYNQSRSNCCGVGGQVFGAPVVVNNLIRWNIMFSEGDGAGIWLHSALAGTVVRGNWIEGNVAYDKGGGLMLYSLAADAILDIEDNVFVDNLSMGLVNDSQPGWGNGGAIWIGGAPSLVRNNTFVGNQGSAIERGLGGSILVSDADGSIIERNIISFTKLGGGIYCTRLTSVVVRDNITWSNMGGNGTGVCAGWSGVDGNIEVDPRFCDLNGHDFSLIPNSPALSHPAGRIGARVSGSCEVFGEATRVP